MGLDDPLIDERDLARTYDGGAYSDPWTAVLDYQAVRRYAGQHPNKGSHAISSALEIPRGRVRGWTDDNGKPDAVRGIETAREHGWLDATDLDPEDRSNDTKLHTNDAIALFKFYRNSETKYGTRAHAFLELAWFTGARQGGLRALDLRDVELGENSYVDFRHRPETGTPLKNKLGGERPVAVPRETADVVGEYIRNHRYDVHDNHSRQPLLASAQGRPGKNTLRVWSYLATLPCLYGPCPHGKEPETC